MFCPECQAEYRPGFTRCADCDVDLVQAPTASAEPKFRSLWQGTEQSECLVVCEILKDADIPYEVAQSVASRHGRMAVDWNFEIAVLVDDYEKAKELTAPDEDFQGADGPKEDEIPEAPEILPSDIAADTENIRRQSYLRKLSPEEATVEIWSLAAGHEASTVELALDANLIRFHIVQFADRTRKIFVTPEDAASAREIIREIEEGTPPV